MKRCFLTLTICPRFICRNSFLQQLAFLGDPEVWNLRKTGKLWGFFSLDWWKVTPFFFFFFYSSHLALLEFMAQIKAAEGKKKKPREGEQGTWFQGNHKVTIRSFEIIISLPAKSQMLSPLKPAQTLAQHQMGPQEEMGLESLWGLLPPLGPGYLS